jgi:hypothetical protein
MPKSSPRAFTDQFLRSNGIFELDTETLLQPAEAAALLGTTTMSLERARKAGDPPPFRQAKSWAAVRYMLSDVLAARQMHRHASIAAVAKAHDDSLVGHMSFSQFLSSAEAKETWPFVVVSVRHVDRPMDFFAALALPIEERKELRWLTLMDYLAALQGALESEPNAELAHERQAAGASYGDGLPSKNRVRPRP